MDQIDRRSGRFHDGDRESKIRWDMTSKLHRDFDSFTPEMNRGIDGVRHHLRQNTHRVERDMPRRPPAWVCEGHNEWEYSFREENRHWVRSKVPILSEFSTKENLLEWPDAVESFFGEMRPPENLKCKLASYALEGEAERWWQQLQHQRIMRGESKVTFWSQMKFLLINDFWPTICSTKCPLRVCNTKLNEKCIFDHPDEFSYSLSFTMMKETPTTEKYVEKFENVKEAEKQGFMPTRCSINCLSQATTTAEVSMKFNKENKEEKSTKDINKDGEEEAMNYIPPGAHNFQQQNVVQLDAPKKKFQSVQYGYGASDGAEVECISSKNVKLWGSISEFGEAHTKEPVTQDTIRETKGIKMDSEDLKEALALVEGCAGDDDQTIDEEEDSDNGRSKENEEESIKVLPVASQFLISETSIREKPSMIVLQDVVSSKYIDNSSQLLAIADLIDSYQQEYGIERHQTNGRYIRKKTLSSYGHLTGYKEQFEVNKAKFLNESTMDMSLLLHNSKNFTSLIYGEYMSIVYSVHEFVSFMFDPGGNLWPIRAPGNTLRLGVMFQKGGNGVPNMLRIKTSCIHLHFLFIGVIVWTYNCGSRFEWLSWDLNIASELSSFRSVSVVQENSGCNYLESLKHTVVWRSATCLCSWLGSIHDDFLSFMRVSIRISIDDMVIRHKNLGVQSLIRIVGVSNDLIIPFVPVWGHVMNEKALLLIVPTGLLQAQFIEDNHLNWQGSTKLDKFMSTVEMLTGLPNCSLKMDNIYIVITFCVVEFLRNWSGQHNTFNISLQENVDHGIIFLNIIISWLGGIIVAGFRMVIYVTLTLHVTFGLMDKSSAAIYQKWTGLCYNPCICIFGVDCTTNFGKVEKTHELCGVGKHGKMLGILICKPCEEILFCRKPWDYTLRMTCGRVIWAESSDFLFVWAESYTEESDFCLGSRERVAHFQSQHEREQQYLLPWIHFLVLLPELLPFFIDQSTCTLTIAEISLGMLHDDFASVTHFMPKLVIVAMFLPLVLLLNFNSTRGRLILSEGWNDTNKKFIMVEIVVVISGSCLSILCKSGQFRKELKLFHKLVNGLDPPKGFNSRLGRFSVLDLAYLWTRSWTSFSSRGMEMM